jgi:hypothetical protein
MKRFSAFPWSGSVLQVYYDVAYARYVLGDANPDGSRWITTKGGQHVLIDKDGKIIGGMGGEHNGQTMVKAGGTSSFSPDAERKKILERKNLYGIRVNQRQNNHIEGTKQYKEYARELEKEGRKPSVLRKDAQALIDKYAGSGTISKRKGEPPREKIRSSEVVGKVWSPESERWTETHTFVIVYSKGDAHIFPKEDED